MFNPDGSRRAAGWMLEGQRTGDWWEWHPDGVVASVTGWRGGKRHGLSRSWYRDGTAKAVRWFENGVEEGVRLIWYKDGTHWQESYRQGRRDGPWSAFLDGKLRILGGFRDGRMHGAWRGWDGAGRLQAVTVYELGAWKSGRRPDGTWPRFFPADANREGLMTHLPLEAGVPDAD